MRFLVLIAALSLAACSSEKSPDPEVPALPTGSYAGEGRNALCVTGSAGRQRAAFVVYGARDENCSVRGIIAPQGLTWTFVPQGDADCRIPLSFNDGQLALGPGTPSCTYYCAPGATFAGKSFVRDEKTRPVRDFGGDTLC